MYDALVRMAQDFVMSSTLVAGHGNFGSVDNDPPAAMRYTECKLSTLARDVLLADIDQVGRWWVGWVSIYRGGTDATGIFHDARMVSKVHILISLSPALS